MNATAELTNREDTWLLTPGKGGLYMIITAQIRQQNV
jgi:hypothetical protein